MSQSIPPSPVPIGCDQCPNRKAKTPFLAVTKKSIVACVLTLGLFPCFFYQPKGTFEFYLKDEPNVPLMMILLFGIGACIDVDLIKKD